MKLEPKRRSATVIVVIVLAAVLTACAVWIFSDTGAHGSYTLTVLFTGDLHGGMDNMPYYYSIIERERKNGNVVLLDCGDLFYGGPRQEQGGIPESLMLAAMRYDAMTLGNNEFKTVANTAKACNEQIKKLAGSVSFPLLCANIEKDGAYLNGVKPYTIINKSGLKIAIIGLTTDDMSNKEVQDKTLRDPVEVLGELTDGLEGKADITLVLSHCEDKQNKNMRNVDAIISGHVHEPTYQAETGFNDTPIVRAGGKDRGHLGKLTLNLIEGTDGWSVESYDFELCLLDNVKPDKKLMAILAELNGVK